MDELTNTNKLTSKLIFTYIIVTERPSKQRIMFLIKTTLTQLVCLPVEEEALSHGKKVKNLGILRQSDQNNAGRHFLRCCHPAKVPVNNSVFPSQQEKIL